MGFYIVKQPHIYTVTCFGRFYDIWEPGIHVTIPGVTAVRSKISVGTDILLNLFRDETRPILVKGGIGVMPDVSVTFRILDPYAVSFGLTMHENLIAMRQEMGITYKEDESYLYGIEEILDSLIRKHLSFLTVEEVLTLSKETKEGDKEFFAKDIADSIEIEADEKLSPYGIDVVEVLFAEVHVVDEKVLAKLREKFDAEQNEKIAKLQIAVEAAKVDVEAQKKLQQKEIGDGAGLKVAQQVEKIVDQGINPEEAIRYLATQNWTAAAKDGANVKIISMGGANGEMSMPIMTGVGMGIGHDAPREEKETTKITEKGESLKTGEKEKSETIEKKSD